MEWHSKWDVERVLSANDITEDSDLDIDDLIDICESYGLEMSDFDLDDIDWGLVASYAEDDDD